MRIYRKVADLVVEAEPAALLTVVAADGSTPQRTGARALVDAEGTLLAGTIGGGLMESRALAAGAQALRENAARIFEFRMDEAYARDAGPICGGVMRILAAPCRPDDAGAYRQALDAIDQGRRGLLLTNLTGPQAGRSHWRDAETLAGGGGPIDDRLETILAAGAPGTVVEPATGCELFAEPICPAPPLLVVGGGHVGQAVARHAQWLGFDVTVLDDRPEFARADRFAAGVRPLCGPIGEQVEAFARTEGCYIVLASKGHKPDAEALERCIASDAAYIGMIGSRRKIQLLRRHFLETGLATTEQFDRVHAPIGLPIGAVTVEEIATSIMAQIVAVRRGGRP